ncbi:MAG: flagellar hook-basal body complex protein FliE [Anaerolineae bacterium]|nr:flagellar hook-basal body complex protein FliE [Anaerolineae bacterium]
MNVGAIGTNGAQFLSPLQSGTKITQPAAKPEGASFGDLMKGAVQQLNQVQNEADVAAMQVATGQGGDLHNALITVEEASLAFQLALQVRNKAIEAYQEVMRMQV